MKATFDGFRLEMNTPLIGEVLQESFTWNLIPKDVPSILEVDHCFVSPTSEWFTLWQNSTLVNAYWNDSRQMVSINMETHSIRLSNQEQKLETQELIGYLHQLSFELASFGAWYPEWNDKAIQKNRVYAKITPFATVGWGCAFQGAGHHRLVSRRWLDYGPWHMQTCANDTSLLYFHDLQADAMTALQQAEPGYSFLNAGFFARPMARMHELKGTYEQATQTLRFVVTGREVSPREMTEACALRTPPLRPEEYAHYERLGLPVQAHTLGEDMPVQRVAYVFLLEEEARAHLHELWLRELECWTFVDGKEVRIDEDYEPPPSQKPDWVHEFAARLEAEERAPTT